MPISLSRFVRCLNAVLVLRTSDENMRKQKFPKDGSFFTDTVTSCDAGTADRPSRHCSDAAGKLWRGGGFKKKYQRFFTEVR